jgi:hypothetical protein
MVCRPLKNRARASIPSLALFQRVSMQTQTMWRAMARRPMTAKILRNTLLAFRGEVPGEE